MNTRVLFNNAPMELPDDWNLRGSDMSSTEIQVGGTHYKDLNIQPIEYILQNDLGYCEGNVIKYVSRWKNKGGVDDLRKAIHYLELLIEDSI